jgi:hypothetical protein
MASVPRFVLVIALLLLHSIPLDADLLILEKVSGKGTAGTTRSIYIKGQRMRIDVSQGKDSRSTVYDLPAGTIVALNADKKRAEVRAMSARYTEVETLYPRQRTSVTVEPTGATKEIAGIASEEYTFLVTVPMTAKGTQPAMTMSGSAWLAKSAPGTADYDAFATAAIERQLVVGYISGNRILLAIARGRTELYRALAALNGIPSSIDMKIRFEGKGMLTALLNKAASGEHASVVTRISVDPMADTLFSIPEGWKRQDKK